MPGNIPFPNRLYEAIAAAFNLAELKDLCFDLRIPYEHLPGETLPGKARELVQYLERYNRVAELLPRLKELRPHSDWDRYEPAEPEAPPPFKGLHYFDEGDAPLFFGRETLTAELVAHLQQHRFLAVVGASGSGKSSLVRAGVVPAVRCGAIEGPGGSSAGWPIHVITPGDEPLKALAASLTRDSESVRAAATLLEDLWQSSESLDLFLYRQMSGQGKGRLLLVVDQFEELFTQCDDGEARRRLVGNLVNAVQSGKQGRLTLILTLRADFYAYAVQYEGLRPLLETRQKIVGTMNQEELRRAIEAPAERGNWAFQPGLVETILQDVGQEPGALPLLSHALQETWARREGRLMTLGGYQAAGGVRRAIAQTADQVYASLTPEQQAIARNIFLRLTELGEGTEDTRRRTALAELLPQDGRPTEIQEILDLLARKRLVILDEERVKAGVSQNYVEVAHEALIREWPTLRGWLDENREGLRLHRQLTEMAEAWDLAGEDASYLYRGGRLVQAQEWADQNLAVLNDLERRFLTASQQAVEQEEEEREARRQKELEIVRQQVERANTIRRATWGLLVMFTIAVGAAFIAFVQRGVAQDSLATATIAQGEAQINLAEAIEQARIAQSQALAASSQTVREQDPMEALLLAIAGGQTAETPLAMDALNRQVPMMIKPLLTLKHDQIVYGAVWNKDESRILSWSGDGTVQVWSATTGDLLLNLGHKNWANGAIWNADESRILSWGCDEAYMLVKCTKGTAQLWDATNGSPLLTLSDESAIVGAMWNEAESYILSWGCNRVDMLSYCAKATIKVWSASTGVLFLSLNHEGEVSGAIWNKDESRILSWGCNETNESDGCTRGGVQIWDTTIGDFLLSLVHESWVSGAMWNEDENRILSWSDDGTVRVWDAVTGDLLLSLNHNNLVSGAMWNEEENRILSWSSDGTARVWDAFTGDLLLTLNHLDWVYGAMWNRDESRILSWSGDGTARVWDAFTGDLLLTLNHVDWVYDAMWNRDESRILSRSYGATVQIWDTDTGELLSTLNHEGWVTGATWNKDESRILSWGADGSRVWDATPLDLLLTLHHEDLIYDAMWNEDESHILSWSDDGTVRMWDALAGNLLLTLSHASRVNGAMWNEDESRILSWSNDETARVWDTANGDLLLTLKHEDSIFGVTGAVWNEDENHILSWGGDGGIKMWDAITGELLLTLGHEGWIIGAVWNGRESRILSWNGDGSIKVWDVITGNLLLTLSHENRVIGARWSRDENHILSWSDDWTTRMWDVSTGNLLLTLNHNKRVNGALWSVDESRILSWSYDGMTKVWDANTGALLLMLNHDDSVFGVTGAIWNKDENYILSWGENGEVQMWDSSTGDLLLTLNHEGAVNGAMWNEDESRILSWSADRTARVWNANTGELLFTLPGNDHSVTVAKWSENERQILLGTSDGFLRVYYTHTEELAALACQYATRNFNWQEWQLYFPGQPYEQTCPHLPMHPSVPESAWP